MFFFILHLEKLELELFSVIRYKKINRIPTLQCLQGLNILNTSPMSREIEY